MPYSSKIFFFALAVSSEPPTIAAAWPIVLPAGAVSPPIYVIDWLIEEDSIDLLTTSRSLGIKSKASLEYGLTFKTTSNLTTFLSLEINWADLSKSGFNWESFLLCDCKIVEDPISE